MAILIHFFKQHFLKESANMEFATNRSFVMSDEADIANELIEKRLAFLIKQNSKPLRVGTPGDCDLCGEWSGRLIDGCCAPCRDRYKLK